MMLTVLCLFTIIKTISKVIMEKRKLGNTDFEITRIGHTIVIQTNYRW